MLWPALFVLAALALASPAAAAEPSVALRLEGGDRKLRRACGKQHPVRVAARGTHVLAALERPRPDGERKARLLVDACRDGEWVRTGERPMGVRDGHFARRLATQDPRDLRLTASVAPGGRSGRAYLRVGVGEIVSEPLAFSVTNHNRTPDDCTGDGERHTVRGHLVGPRSRIDARRPSVTLYLHGSVLGEPTWRFRAVRGHDHLRRMAERGHVSVAYDQLGYGRSDVPDGERVCGGAQADVAHQVVGKLHKRFDRVALFGFSFGGFVAELEALTFADVDALAVESWSDHLGDRFYRESLPSATACAEGGEPKRPGAAGGYTYFFRHEDEHVMLANARPAVVSALYAAHERDPCGLNESLPQIARNRTAVRNIDVPVLLVYGKRDALFGKSASERQRESYSGTSDLTYRRIDKAGHFLTLERRRGRFRALVSGWLRKRGF